MLYHRLCRRPIRSGLASLRPSARMPLPRVVRRLRLLPSLLRIHHFLQQRPICTLRSKHALRTRVHSLLHPCSPHLLLRTRRAGLRLAPRVSLRRSTQPCWLALRRLLLLARALQPRTGPHRPTQSRSPTRSLVVPARFSRMRSGRGSGMRRDASRSQRCTTMELQLQHLLMARALQPRTPLLRMCLSIRLHP